MAKRRTALCVDEDRISQLPVEIAAKILSSLSLKEAARTSVLSKPWRKRWLFRTAFDFDVYRVFTNDQGLQRPGICSEPPVRTPEYVEWINKVLQDRLEATGGSGELTRLRVRLQFGGGQKHVDDWVSHALASRVQSLELDLLNRSNYRVVVRRRLTFPPFQAAYTPLTSLSLSGLKVTGEAIESFLNCLPSLEHLKLCGSPARVRHLLIRGCPSLKHLQILHCLGIKTVTVRDTSLVSFTFTQILNLDLGHNPNLVVLRACDVSDGFFYAQISDCLPQVQTLTFYAAYGSSCRRLGFPIMNGLKQLTIILDPVQEEALHRVTAMLRSAPNLEKLALEFIFLRGFNEKPRVASEKRVFAKGRQKIGLPHLQVVEVRGYYGEVAEDRIVEYLLDHVVAPKLKPVVFDPRGLGRDPDMPLLNCFPWRRDQEKSEERLAQQFRRVVPHFTLLA